MEHNTHKHEHHEEPKRLYRSSKNKVFAGICGGLGEYFNLDPVLLRLAWVLVTFVSGIAPGIIAYIVAIFIVPKQPLA